MGGLRLRFRGVRGSIATPSAACLDFGGNTACLEIGWEDQLPLVLDAGTGLRGLGLDLAGQSGEMHLFLTHFHWDHISGIPFFGPLFSPEWTLVFHSALPADELEKILRAQLRHPYYPAEDAIRARCVYRQIEPRGVRVGGLDIRPVPLHHPGGAVGYRIDAPEASIVYACDHEHGDAAADRALREQIRDAGVLVWDAQYTPAEYERRRGWGHSTWLEGTRAAREAGAGRLVLCHHDPDHDDEAVLRIENQARAEFENAVAAREDAEISLPASASPALR